MGLVGGPCREEFPAFQEQAAERLDEVAFIGLNAGDSEDSAATFLEGHPVPYPSFSDPDEEIATSCGATFFPSTSFIDASAEVVYTHTGPYADPASSPRTSTATRSAPSATEPRRSRSR